MTTSTVLTCMKYRVLHSNAAFNKFDVPKNIFDCWANITTWFTAFCLLFFSFVYFSLSLLERERERERVYEKLYFFHSPSTLVCFIPSSSGYMLVSTKAAQWMTTSTPTMMSRTVFSLRMSPVTTFIGWFVSCSGIRGFGQICWTRTKKIKTRYIFEENSLYTHPEYFGMVSNQGNGFPWLVDLFLATILRHVVQQIHWIQWPGQLDSSRLPFFEFYEFWDTNTGEGSRLINQFESIQFESSQFESSQFESSQFCGVLFVMMMLRKLRGNFKWVKIFLSQIFINQWRLVQTCFSTQAVGAWGTASKLNNIYRRTQRQRLTSSIDSKDSKYQAKYQHQAICKVPSKVPTSGYLQSTKQSTNIRLFAKCVRGRKQQKVRQESNHTQNSHCLLIIRAVQNGCKILNEKDFRKVMLLERKGMEGQGIRTSFSETHPPLEREAGWVEVIWPKSCVY